MEPVSTSTATTGLYYIHNDHLGTPKLLTDAEQNVVWEIHTTPFGEVHQDIANGIANIKAFPGQYRDRETGLSYNYYRDYDPSVGRYIQSDPIGLGGGLNTYGYVGGNPVGFVDPLGLEAISPVDSRNICLANPQACFDAGMITAIQFSILMNENSESKSFSEKRTDGDECGCTYYHYTNSSGYAAIVASNFTITGNAKGVVYLTTNMYSQSEAEQALFMGGFAGYSGKGSHVIAMELRCGTPLEPGTQPNELLHFGSLRLGRQIEQIYFSGPNPF